MTTSMKITAFCYVLLGGEQLTAPEPYLRRHCEHALTLEQLQKHSSRHVYCWCFRIMDKLLPGAACFGWKGGTPRQPPRPWAIPESETPNRLDVAQRKYTSHCPPFAESKFRLPNLGADERLDRKAGRAARVRDRLVSGEQQAHGERLYDTINTGDKTKTRKKKKFKRVPKNIRHVFLVFEFTPTPCPPAWVRALERRHTHLLLEQSFGFAERKGRQPYKPCLPTRDPIRRTCDRSRPISRSTQTVTARRRHCYIPEGKARGLDGLIGSENFFFCGRYEFAHPNIIEKRVMLCRASHTLGGSWVPRKW